MNVSGHDLGVCSWSLRPRDMAELVERMRLLELKHLQLGLLHLLKHEPDLRERELDVLRGSGLVITATMISFPGEDYSSIPIIRETGGFAPTALWPDRRGLVVEAAKLSAGLGVPMLSSHIGFVPQSNHEAYPLLVERVRDVASELGDMEVDLLVETGPEPGTELLQFLNDLGTRNVHVNYDPANMILYGTDDPIEPIGILGRHIRHVHLKDATLSEQPGIAWGSEVPLGTGQVNLRRMLAALKEVGYTGPLIIEREAGENPAADIQSGLAALQAAAQPDADAVSPRG